MGKAGLLSNPLVEDIRKAWNDAPVGAVDNGRKLPYLVMFGFFQDALRPHAFRQIWEQSLEYDLPPDGGCCDLESFARLCLPHTYCLPGVLDLDKSSGWTSESLYQLHYQNAEVNTESNAHQAV